MLKTVIDLDFGAIKVYDLRPQTLPDLFRGQQLVLLGRYAGDGNAKISLSGYVDGKKAKKIKYLSNEYFELVKNQKGIGKYLSTGKNVIIVINGEAYKIYE